MQPELIADGAGTISASMGLLVDKGDMGGRAIRSAVVFKDGVAKYVGVDAGQPEASSAETIMGMLKKEREDAEETLKAGGSELKGGWPLVTEALTRTTYTKSPSPHPDPDQVIEAFTLTTVAEIGDRSQLATIALSAAGNPLGVCAGATAGHFLATGTAVIAGSYLSQYLSERGILILGGLLFLIFALTTAFGIF